MRLFPLFTLCTVVLFGPLSSCATIVSGSKQRVVFTSSPTNAALSINGVPYGTTPASVNLRRKDSHAIRIEVDGYEPYETFIDRKFNAWMLGNIVFGGLIGIVVDAATGSMYKLDTKAVLANLDGEGAFLGRDGAFYLDVKLNVDPTDLEKIGQLTPTGR